MIELPWSEATEDNLDMAQARQILDEDHYDLEKVKKRILEYLAVRKLKPDMKGPILCFVGPPGTGKTSLGQSIARALGRKFVRISLGGVRDEAEIRGHRRTYVGALPGRIIQGMRRAGSNNPVFMLDEVDKIGADFRGDPSSALLEVLDPEQNNSFPDHYLDVPFDLSKVMFITTANMLDTIPPALRDRMEVLQLPGYTEEEKVEIAERHLIPRQLRGQRADRRATSTFTRGALRQIIARLHPGGGAAQPGAGDRHHLPRGGRARSPEGETARRSHQDPARGPKYLGPARASSGTRPRRAPPTPGVATGLAWTPVRRRHPVHRGHRHAGQGPPDPDRPAGRRHEGVGPGGALPTSGPERIQARAVRRDFFEKPGHPHPRARPGPSPRTGPRPASPCSRALVSLLTKRRVNKDLAMTGEITLRGQVLPVGGIKEKVLAAHRAGIKEIILPAQNEVDLEEIPESVRQELSFHPVERLDEALEMAFPPRKSRGKRRKRVKGEKEKAHRGRVPDVGCVPRTTASFCLFKT